MSKIVNNDKFCSVGDSEINQVDFDVMTLTQNLYGLRYKHNLVKRAVLEIFGRRSISWKLIVLVREY